MPQSDKAKHPKPYPDFPLTVHPSGRWCKKIKQKTYYFGPLADWQAALDKYLREKDDLQAGRKPREESDGVDVREVVNRFLTAKRHLLDTRELSPRTFKDYHGTCLRVAAKFGKTRAVADLQPDDFEALRADFAKTRGPLALGDEVRRTRSLFKYAYDAGLISAAVRFGPTFKAPGKKVIRQARNAAGSRMLEAEELRRILAYYAGEKVTLPAATKRGKPVETPGKPHPALRAMTLLAINCGLGNTDCATLPLSAVDLQTGWLDFPRPKTAVPRRVPLWPETVASLALAIENRPKAKRNSGHGKLVFLTRLGQPWVRMDERQAIGAADSGWTPVDSVGLMFGRTLRELGLKRPGLNFYSIRHAFETVAGETADQVAVNAVMGHDPGDMASLYRERISNERLRAVTDHVREWLFAK